MRGREVVGAARLKTGCDDDDVVETCTLLAVVRVFQLAQVKASQLARCTSKFWRTRYFSLSGCTNDADIHVHFPCT